MAKKQHDTRAEAREAEVEAAGKPVVVPKYKQCPSCYGGRGGIGVERWHRRINGVLLKKCYQCDTCGFDWTATVRTVTETVNVQYHDVQVEHGDVDMETR